MQERLDIIKSKLKTAKIYDELKEVIADYIEAELNAKVASTKAKAALIKLRAANPYYSGALEELQGSTENQIDLKIDLNAENKQLYLTIDCETWILSNGITFYLNIKIEQDDYKFETDEFKIKYLID